MKLIKNIECQSCTSVLCNIRQDVKAACQDFGYPDADINNIVLAIDEACANVIRYGYKYCEKGWVGLKIYDNGSEAVFHISDRCAEICEADLAVKPRSDDQPGGLGLHIIHEVMDSVHLVDGPVEGNTLELRKQLPPKEAQGQ